MKRKTNARLTGVAMLASVSGGVGVERSARALDTHDPNVTATVYVHGFSVSGWEEHGVYGDDVHEPLLSELAALLGLPTTNEPGGEFYPNVVAATTYYGDVYPNYYTQQDVADVAAITEQWGGGIPRYAMIVAKYAEYVMERSGARQVNFVSASMGSFVTRWLIEKDVEGLASAGKIARWTTVEGVVAGNWAASNEDLIDIWEIFDTPPIDIEHMNYDWFEQYLHAPRQSLDNPLFSNVLVTQIGSTKDDDLGGALTLAMVLWGEYQPNDSVQGLEDAYFHDITSRSLFLNQWPPLSYFHTDHLSIADHTGAHTLLAGVISQRKRVKITMTRAQMNDIQEGLLMRPAEIVFLSRVFSPMARSRWGVTEPICELDIEGVASPIRPFDAPRQERYFQHVIYDDFVFEEEQRFDLDLAAAEIDWHVRYDMFEPLVGEYQDIPGGSVSVPIDHPGVYRFTFPTWNCDLKVETYYYPFSLLGCDGPGGERLKKAKCKNGGGVHELTVLLTDGAPDAPFAVQVDGVASRQGTFNGRGKGKVKFDDAELRGSGEVLALFQCGVRTGNYDCN